MTTFRSILERVPLIYWLIIIYSIWSSRVLILEAWMQAPLEAWTPWVFAVWIIPLLVQLYAPLARRRFVSHTLALSALFLQVLGDIGSINMLHYIGLVFALGAIMPTSVSLFAWLFTAWAWMPAFGWMSARYFGFAPLLLRFAFVLIGVGWWCMWRFKQIDQQKV